MNSIIQKRSLGKPEPSDDCLFTLTILGRILIEQWRREYNQVRHHSSLGYRPPAPEARIPVTLT